MPKCRSPKCNADIVWIKTPMGKPMCVNPGAVTIRSYVPDTTRTTIVTREGETISGTTVEPDDVDALKGKIELFEGFVPHWSTCKDAERFRKRSNRNSKGLSFRQRKTL